VRVADLSPGTEIVSGSTGWEYTVETLKEETVIVRGPNGPLEVDRDELQKNIANGIVGVRS
jgi:hypothetical protein